MKSVRPLEVAGVQLKVPLNTKRARREAAEAISGQHATTTILERNRIEGERLREATRQARIAKKRMGDAVEAAVKFLAEFDAYAASDAVAFVPSAKVLDSLRKSLSPAE